MNSHEGLTRLRARASSRGRLTLVCALATLVCAPALLHAKDAVRNLGGGLEQIAAQSAAPAARSAARAEPEEQVLPAVQFDDAGACWCASRSMARCPVRASSRVSAAWMEWKSLLPT